MLTPPLRSFDSTIDPTGSPRVETALLPGMGTIGAAPVTAPAVAIPLGALKVAAPWMLLAGTTTSVGSIEHGQEP